ncbi:high mobility group protein hmg-12 [Onychostoma macrolepis]|uniref:high mobility group protein hmg-12 n=1 Tax=Onychostoma macrolepis TaxID=369639 RepID=UPI00272C7553|nr:high mobility group protein hmg-12 [Onychostoma macrolepis]XP_058610108.1 high mobility group protein hmg-12 [Onychostoma macrolepis]
MEVENKEETESPLPNGSTHPPKRGRGRPRGSLNKKFTTEKAPTHNSRPSKKVDFFSPDIVIKTKVKKRGRPKKIKMPGRPRKIPLTPEEESERLHRLSLQRKRRLSKPLGRPRIHPIAEDPKVKRGRGRPRKYGTKSGSQSGGAKQASVEISLDAANGPPRKRGRPAGSLKRKRGRPAGSTKVAKIARASDGTPKRRGRPPGSPNKVKKIQRADGSPRKRGRPPGSGTKLKVIQRNPDGTPRKRGRPPGSGKKVKIVEKKVGDTPRKRGRPPGTGKVKAHAAEGGETGGENSDGAAPRRKRGRPSKVRLAVVLEKLPKGSAEEDEEETDAPSPKQSRTSDDSSQNPNDDDEDTRASENDADPEDEEDDEDDAIDCSKVNNTSENEMVGKFKKKK